MRRLARLYPRRWRERYGAEIDAFLERRWVTPRAMLDLMRGIIDAHLHPALAFGLVFVPEIGFRPAGTRVLARPIEATVDGTRLRVLRVAASRDATDVRVEWERRFDHSACPEIVSALSSREPMEGLFRVELVAGATQLPASLMARSSYSLGAFDGTRSTVRAVQALRFPALPETHDPVELRIAVGEERWRVALDLGAAAGSGVPLDVEDDKGGITVRATAMTLTADELLVELEVRSPLPLRNVAAAVPSPPTFAADDAETRRARRAEMRRVLGDRSRPIVLEDERGARSEEISRVTPPDRPSATAQPPHIYRFAVAFDRPGTLTRVVTLIIPFIDVSDFRPTVTVDLREIPVDVELGGQAFRVVSAEAHGDERHILLEIPPSEAHSRFLHPARVRGTAETFSWGDVPGRGFSMSTRVGDPPIVTFQGVALRVEGSWRLDLPVPQ